jgi:hypothetical protein
MKLLIMQFSPNSFHFISVRFKYFFNTLFLIAVSLCSFLNVRDQISQPYRAIGKIIVFHILIFKFLDNPLF